LIRDIYPDVLFAIGIDLFDDGHARDTRLKALVPVAPTKTASSGVNESRKFTSKPIARIKVRTLIKKLASRFSSE
jgi:hypothetical protein